MNQEYFFLFDIDHLEVLSTFELLQTQILIKYKNSSGLWAYCCNQANAEFPVLNVVKFYFFDHGDH